MERYEYLGRGEHASHTYEVAITWSGQVYENISPHPVTICLIDLSGTSSFGSVVWDLPLCSLLEERYQEHLSVCGCLWLRDLALQEQAAGRVFSADEIFAAWHARTA